MMKFGKYVVTAFAIGILLAGVSGCEEGPAEHAGKQIDRAADKTGQQIDKAGDKIRNSAHDTKI